MRTFIIDGLNSNKEVSDLYLTSSCLIDVRKASVAECVSIALFEKNDFRREDFDNDDLRPLLLERAFATAEGVLFPDYGTIKTVADRYDLEDEEEVEKFIAAVMKMAQLLSSEELNVGVERIDYIDWKVITK